MYSHNINVFIDTQNKINNIPALRELTDNAINNTYIIDEGFVSKKNKSECHYADFEENLSLITAKKFIKKGCRTAVLNFANPFRPGGGVECGANAQEEYLCRATNLYNCLTAKHVYPYYEYHNMLMNKNSNTNAFLGTDKIIYSPNVTIIKKDINYIAGTDCIPQQIYTEQWYKVDIITCAAPYFSDNSMLLSDGDLFHLFKRRIKNIFEAAIENEIDVLVAGAFGCGAFHNPPDLVAFAFREVFSNPRYKGAFDLIFAVKRSGYYSKNIEAFDSVFSHYPQTILSMEGIKRNSK